MVHGMAKWPKLHTRVRFDMSFTCIINYTDVQILYKILIRFIPFDLLGHIKSNDIIPDVDSRKVLRITMLFTL